MGARWSESGGRAALVVGSGSSWARGGISFALWSIGTMVRGGEWREVSFVFTSDIRGMGEVPKGGQWANLVVPFGSRFAAAMMRQS